MDATGLLKESEVYTSCYDSREGRWTKRSVNDTSLNGDYHGHFIAAPFYKVRV